MTETSTQRGCSHPNLRREPPKGKRGESASDEWLVLASAALGEPRSPTVDNWVAHNANNAFTGTTRCGKPAGSGSVSPGP